jgi:hypothetical protein
MAGRAWLSTAGEIVLDPATPPAARRWERLLDEDQFELLRPFEITGKLRGLDLVTPRPRLRIVPASCRAPRMCIARGSRPRRWRPLARRCLMSERIVAPCPTIETADVRDALDLETQLQLDLAIAG